jgi:hypothetical protein
MSVVGGAVVDGCASAPDRVSEQPIRTRWGRTVVLISHVAAG